MQFEFKGNEHGIQEQADRDISVDTVTKEELEKGEVKMSISKDRLQSEKFRKLLDDKIKEIDSSFIKLKNPGDKNFRYAENSPDFFKQEGLIQ